MEESTAPGQKRARESDDKIVEPAAKRQKIEEEEVKSSIAS
jgi:hypothetical protein